MLNFKKITSMILAVSACAALSVTAFAEEEADTAKYSTVTISTVGEDGATATPLADLQQDEDGNYYFEDEDGNKIYLTITEKTGDIENNSEAGEDGAVKMNAIEVNEDMEPAADGDTKVPFTWKNLVAPLKAVFAPQQ